MTVPCFVASLGSALTYASSVASAFGDFQIGNRQRRYNNASANDPRKSLYSQDVAWATNMKSLRNQTYDVAGDAISDYYASVTSAYTSYASGVLTTLSTAEQAYFSALKTYSIAALNVDGDYSLALFTAERNRAEDYIDAAIAELTANYATEASLAASRASAYATQLAAVEALFSATQFAEGRGEYDALLQGTSSDQTDYFDEIVSTSSQVVSTQTSVNSADATLATQNASALASAQASNAAAYTFATEQAEADYTTAVNSAWNDAYLDQLSVVSDFEDAYELAISTLNTALENHANNYRDAVFAAYDAFEEDWGEIARVLSYQQTRIDFGLTVGSNVFENPTFDFEICFVAGTPVLMADGTTKPIEEIRPGDMVLAANHLDPEGKPKAARVARFFDNGEKTVVRLVVGEQELVCTLEHPFYVVGKGWVRAEELVEGDLCLNADGECVAFVSREALAEKRRVYNIEVGEAHTYFVGYDGVLAHNRCDECGAAWYNVGHAIYGCPVANARNREKMKNLGLTPLSAVDEVQTHENAKWAEEAATELASTLASTVPGFDIMMDLSQISNGRQLLSYAAKKITFEYLVPGVISKIAGNKTARNSWDLSWDAILIKLDKTSRFAHYEVRKCLNLSGQFGQFQKEIGDRFSKLEEARIDANRNPKKVVTFELGGVLWQVLPDSAAKYHGVDCFKLTYGRRELVIDRNGKIEERPEFLGTFNYWPLSREGGKFNYGVSVSLHAVSDVLPYWLWGNSLQDSTFFWERIYVMSKKGSGPVEERLYPNEN